MDLGSNSTALNEFRINWEWCKKETANRGLRTTEGLKTSNRFSENHIVYKTITIKDWNFVPCTFWLYNNLKTIPDHCYDFIQLRLRPKRWLTVKSNYFYCFYVVIYIFSLTGFTSTQIEKINKIEKRYKIPGIYARHTQHMSYTTPKLQSEILSLQL